MKNKLFYLCSFFSFLIKLNVYGGDYLPCGSSTGNRLMQNTAGYVFPTVPPCGFRVPDLRPRWDRITGRGWRIYGSLKQIPAPGTLISRSGPACASGSFTVTISANFIYDNGTPVNPRDDRYCSVDALDSYFWVDLESPRATNISFTTSNTDFSPSGLKTYFTTLSDNCTPLSVLQDNLEFIADPRRPAYAEIRCGSTNTYRVLFRTRDACGRVSNWATATIRFVDVIPPSRPVIIVPSYFYTNTICQSFISPSMITAYSHDDLSDAAEIRYSYRIIAPTHLRGDIPLAGRWLNASAACPVNGLVTLRVCSQDCSGNGNLHVGDDVLDVNCDYVKFNLRDTIKPMLRSDCGNITQELLANCNNTMPNLAASLTVSDNCSAISVYQLPAPGSLLNDGVSHAPGLASGAPRSFTCTLANEDDDFVDCTSSMGIFKSIPVSFILVDCDGNCTLLPNCIIVNLSTTTSPVAGITGGPLLADVKPKWSRPESALSLSNQPNPFHDFTDIRITGQPSGTGILRFFTPEGRTLHLRNVNPGELIQRIQKQDLNTQGLVFYTYSYRDDLTGEQKKIWNKMLVY